jgi:iron complex outermembrane receptor protein
MFLKVMLQSYSDSRRGRSIIVGRRQNQWLLSMIPIGCMATVVLAQTAPTSDATKTKLEEVVVTGTSIRDAQPVSSDLITIGPEAIEQIGAPNTADLLRKVPQLNSFNGVVRTELVAATGVASPPGLRNLNPNATLVLMNGHRLIAENPLDTFSDPSSIPPAAIERIEIVADGASAIYGSDAVAGVINIILKKDLDGAKTSIRGGWGQHGYDAIDVSQAFGNVWSTGSAMVVVGYNKNSDVSNADLPYYTDDLSPFGGVDLRPTNCAPPNLILGGVTYAPPNYTPGVAARCTPGLRNDNVPEFQRVAVVANARQDISDKLSLFGDLRYTDTDVRHIADPGGTNVTLTTANPFFLRPSGATEDSETAVMNLSSVIGQVTNRADSKSTDIMVGANYRLPRDFRLQGTFNYGLGKNKARQAGSDAAAISAAAAGTTLDTALDPFQGRTNPAVVAAIADFENFIASEQTMYDYQAKVDGSLFTLPGGEVKVAVGLDYRRYVYEAENTVGQIGQNQNRGAASATRTTKAAFGEVHVPLVGPGNAVPLIQSLNISAAVRYDDYSDFGDTTNPKYGVTWSPVEGLAFRASYGKSFHAPDMGDSYAVDTRALYFVNFPLVPPGSPPVDSIALAGGNPGLQPEKAETYSFGLDFNPTWLDGFRAGVTYWNIEYNGLIRTAPISPEVFTNPAFAAFYVLNPTQAQIDEIEANFRVVGTTLPIPPGVGQIIDLRRHNLGATQLDGIDYSASYGWDAGIGSFVAGVSGSRTMSFDLQSAVGAPFLPQENFVKGNLRAELLWRRGPMAAGAALNHSGTYQQVYNLSAGGTGVQTVDGFDTVDLRASYEFEEGRGGWLGGVTLSLNVDNALNEDPPLRLAAGGFSSFASPLGRQVWAGLHKDW